MNRKFFQLLIGGAMIIAPTWGFALTSVTSSGGYRSASPPSISRPSPSPTPSFRPASPPSAAPIIRPSVQSSGGYSKSNDAPIVVPSARLPSSASDRAVAGSTALTNLNASRNPSSGSGSGTNYNSGSNYSGSGSSGTRTVFVHHYSYAPPPPPPLWSPPAYYTYPPSNALDTAVAASILYNLDRAGRDADADRYFREHRNSDEYQRWRADAEQQAANNPELRAKLDNIDRIDPPKSEGISPWVYVIVVVGLGVSAVLIYLVLFRPKTIAQTIVGTRETIKPTPPPLKQKEKQLYTVGMPLTLDESTFILLGSDLPNVARPQGRETVVGVERINISGNTHVRLHLEGNRMVQLFPEENPTEARYFTRVDQVFPETDEDRSFWLDPDNGNIGNKQFVDRTEVSFTRVWGHSDDHVSPVIERQVSLDGTVETSSRREAMLYARETGHTTPAPEWHYLLVETFENSRQFSIDISEGIDILPSSLNLPV